MDSLLAHVLSLGARHNQLCSRDYTMQLKCVSGRYVASWGPAWLSDSGAKPSAKYAIAADAATATAAVEALRDALVSLDAEDEEEDLEAQLEASVEWTKWRKQLAERKAQNG